MRLDWIRKVLVGLRHMLLDVGFHEVVWDASDVSSGVYLCQLTTNNTLFTNKMILIK